ncbi:MAG: hypothetical protein WC935_05005 [Thermoleophilia bacterium]
MKKVALAIVILALMSSVAMAGVVRYHGSKNDSRKKSGNCEYGKVENGKKNEECDD